MYIVIVTQIETGYVWLAGYARTLNEIPNEYRQVLPDCEFEFVEIDEFDNALTDIQRAQIELHGWLHIGAGPY